MLGGQHEGILSARPLPRRGRIARGASSTGIRRDEILTETTDPRGNDIVLLRRIWEGKILRDHRELDAHLAAVLRAVADPDHVANDPSSFDRTRYYARDAGPSRWLLVVVSYEQQPARIVSAFGTRKDPISWSE